MPSRNDHHGTIRSISRIRQPNDQYEQVQVADSGKKQCRRGIGPAPGAAKTKQSNPYLYNGGNLLITVVDSASAVARGGKVKNYYYRPLHGKQCVAVWGSNNQQFSDIYTAGAKILNTDSGQKIGRAHV